jgi:hypothetical protein
MSLGRKTQRPDDPIPAASPRTAPRGSFYERLARALEAEAFDAWVEELVRPYYAPRRGRPSLAPGIYFRMLIVSSLEGIVSQRELAWRCNDSLCVRRFLGYSPTDATPDHSTLTLAKQRLPPDVHAEAMRALWNAARKHDVLRGRSLSPGATFFDPIWSDPAPPEAS